MSRSFRSLLLWFGLSFVIIQVAATALELWRTKRPTDMDAAQALEVGPRTADLSCLTCGRP